MSPGKLRIVLAVSVALNLFAVAAGVSAYLNHAAAQDRIEQSRPERARVSVMDVANELEPEVRDQVKSALRAAAMSARPDFRDAREARREAILLAEGETFDARAVTALLERSRASENRGRVILESEAVRLLGELSPEDRVSMSGLLRRHSPMHRRGGRDDERSAQPPDETPSSQN